MKAHIINLILYAISRETRQSWFHLRKLRELGKYLSKITFFQKLFYSKLAHRNRMNRLSFHTIELVLEQNLRQVKRARVFLTVVCFLINITVFSNMKRFERFVARLIYPGISLICMDGITHNKRDDGCDMFRNGHAWSDPFCFLHRCESKMFFVAMFHNIIFCKVV